LSAAVPYGPMICADETDCSWEKITLCAFEQAGSRTEDQLPFLQCMDTHTLPLFFDEAVPRECALKARLDWNATYACFNGSRGDDLLSNAQKEVERKIGEGSFELPLVQVNGREICTGKNCSYAVVSEHLPSRSGPETSPSIVYYFASK